MNGDEKNKGLSEIDRNVWQDATRSIKPQQDQKQKKRKDAQKPPPTCLPDDMDLWKTYIENGAISKEIGTSPLLPQQTEHLLPPASKPKQNRLLANQLSDLDKRSFEKLRKGRIPLDGQFDFHGISLHEAKYKLHQLINDWHESGARCVLLITGKGKRSPKEHATIKESLSEWLNETTVRPKILALTKAQPKDGGEGAFYVLLRKKK